MCGIAGIVNGNVQPMVDSQTHRGPDHKGVWTDGIVSFGHNRLSILDLSESGNQPMISNRYVLTYVGEIYNYKELQSYLSKDDDMALADNYGNDARTLLLYIEKFGLDKALRDINGQYAFGLYDKQDRIIHLVVDRFSQKPLYYTTDSFAFASSPAALLHLKSKWSINQQALQSYWKLGGVMVDSIFDGIYKLNAAEHLTYKDGKYAVERYWMPTYQTNTNDIEELVLDSIRKVKVSDVPIYTFLSGGIDSTLVASQFKGGNAIHLHGPEQVYAERVAKQFDINLRIVTPATVDPIASMTDYVRKSGEMAMAALTPYIVSQEAAKYCKVAISANGADELFFGYDRTTDSVTREQINHIFRSCINAGRMFLPTLDDRLSDGRFFELMTYVQHDLNKTLDFASMAHSLEVRNPFLDHRLVEMALSIPAAQMGRKAVLKGMLTKMGFDSAFLNRNKLGFTLYEPIPDHERLQTEAYDWAIKEGWLKLTAQPNRRDLMYLRSSVFSFKVWWETFKKIIE